MNANASPRRGPGRPPRATGSREDTRAALLRQGMAMLTERGFNSVGIDEVLRAVGVPKGSFYYYFSSKDDFGLATLESYADYFARKLDRHFLDTALPPLARIAAFVADAERGMARHQFRRGCLVGNLGQEMSALSEPFRLRLEAVFQDWEARLAACLQAAVAAGELAADTDCARWAVFFWTGWEGAVLRARLAADGAPLRLFGEVFLGALPRPPSPA